MDSFINFNVSPSPMVTIGLGARKDGETEKSIKIMVKILENIEQKTENYLKEFNDGILPKINAVGKLLDQEYKKEIVDQIDFLKNIAMIAGIVAPFSLTLLLSQSLNIQKGYLIFGFVLLITTILVSLLFSKKIILDEQYKDTSKLSFNYIMSKTSTYLLSDKNKTSSERLIISTDVIKNIENVSNKFNDLGYTNKLASLEMKLLKINNWSILLFSFGLIFIIISVVYPYVVISLTYLIESIFRF